MGLELVRCDDRLIHGQVVIGWTRSRGITTIVAVDDKTASDKFQMQLMKMATPPGVKPIFLSVEDAIKKIKDGEFEKSKYMILVKTPKTINDLISGGVNIKEVNVGNQRSGEGKVKLLNFVYSTNDEIAEWKKLNDNGIKLYGQTLPDTPSFDMNEIASKL